MAGWLPGCLAGWVSGWLAERLAGWQSGRFGLIWFRCAFGVAAIWFCIGSMPFWFQSALFGSPSFWFEFMLVCLGSALVHFVVNAVRVAFMLVSSWFDRVSLSVGLVSVGFVVGFDLAWLGFGAGFNGIIVEMRGKILGPYHNFGSPEPLVFPNI